MSALQPRTWAEGDRVAQVDRSVSPWRWRLGTVTGLDGPRWLIVRWNDETPLDSYVSCVGADDRNLVPADEVPVDERHWLPERMRDLLVRQEAAERLLAMADAVVGAQYSEPLADLADDLNDLLIPGQQWLITAARALLTPAPTPARTPQ